MRLKEIFLVLCLSTLFVSNAFAFQNCQSKYDSDKRSLPSIRGMCNVCHISPNGGGPTNEFGMAFEQAGFMISDSLVAKFPNLFQKPSEEPSPSPNAGSTTSSSSSSGQEVTPVIKRIKPKAVKINVQSMASVLGKNFTDGAKAFIDGSEVITTFKSKAKLVIDFVLSTVGIHEIKVQNPDGQESNAANITGK